MSQIEAQLKQPTGKPKDSWLAALSDALHEWTSRVALILNAGLRFDDNFSISKVSVTSDATPNTEFTVAHTLKRTPIGYFVIRKDKAGDVYDGSTAFDASNIYLKSSVASVTMTLYIF